MKNCLYFFVWLQCIQQLLGVSVSPTWVTSSYVQAGSSSLINNVRIGNESTPSATLTFGTAFTSAPNLCYGIINYEGDDGMMS
jgi:hypothetical protein